MSKTILITGTSSGMGRDMVGLFAEKGWNVAATMRNPARDGAELAALDGVNTYALDVTDRASIEAAVAATLADFGSLNAVVNNAGFGIVGPMEGASDEQIDRQLAVNLRGPIDVMRAVLPHMRAQKSGVIVNVTSVGGRVSLPHNALYHGTKWGLEGLTEGMVYELAPLGIHLKLIEPGGIQTDFATRSLSLTDASVDPAYQSQLAKIMESFQSRAGSWSPPSIVSDAVWEAVTDGTNRLRYPVGEDAKRMLDMRASTDDGQWIGAIRSQFEL